MNQRLGQILFAAEWQAFIARAERLAGRYDASVRNARDALDAFSAMGNLGRLPALFDDFAALEIVRGHATRATQLGAAAARYADGSSCLEGTAKSQRSAG